MSANVNAPGTPREIGYDAGASSAPASAPATGQWNGMTVSRGEHASLLADAAEEMTFGAGTHLHKDFAARKKNADPVKHPVQAEIQPPPGARDELRKQLGDRVAQLAARIRHDGGNPAALKQALEEGFPDTAERHAALEAVEELLADEPSLAELVGRERRTLEVEHGPAIQAGYNIHAVDASAVGGPGAGREAYGRTILGHAGIGAAMEDILARHGVDGFVGAVDFLRAAVAADLSAASASTDKNELRSMNDDLYHLRALGNFAKDFDSELAGLREKGGKPPLPRAAVETLRLLAKAKDQRVPILESLRSHLVLEGEKDSTYDVRALTATHTLARNLPHKLFDDPESRPRLLDAVQRMLDVAVDLEESLLSEE